MTIDELIDLVRDVGKWSVNRVGYVRCEREGIEATFCPLTAAYWKRTGVILKKSHFRKAMKELQIDDLAGNLIAEASDHCLHSESVKECRKKLLALCSNRGNP